MLSLPSCFAEDVHNPLPRTLLHGSMMGIGALWATTALVDGVLAQVPSGCTGGSGTYTCSGDQSGGFEFPNEVNGTLVRSVTVKNLSRDVTGRFSLESLATAAEGPVSLSVDLGSATQTVNATEQNFLLRSGPVGSGASAARINGHFTGTATNNGNEAVIVQTTVGAAGANGGSPDDKNGEPGGQGGNGGTNTLVLSQGGSSTLTSTNATSLPVIFIANTGGAGGDGGEGGKYTGIYFVRRSGGAGGDGGGTNSIYLSTENVTNVIGTLGGIALHNYGGAGGAGGEGRLNNALGGNAAGGQGGAGGVGGDVYFDINTSGNASSGSWDIMLSQSGTAIDIVSAGGKGGNAGRGKESASGNGGDGGDSGAIRFGAANRSIELLSSGSKAVRLLSKGGNGGVGGFVDGTGAPGFGGQGGSASEIVLNGGWDITGTAEQTIGIYALSQGGNGGVAGYTGKGTSSPPGGSGGIGGSVSSVISSSSTIATTGSAIDLISRGGSGGEGSRDGASGTGGAGGLGGNGGEVALDVIAGTGDGSLAGWDISIGGTLAKGIRLESSGGTGGNGGRADDAGGNGGGGGAGGDGGVIRIAKGSRTIVSTGLQSAGVYASSTGGDGGTGGSSYNGGAGGAGGSGGSIVMDAGSTSLDPDWNLTITNDDSTGFWLRSKGGAGGLPGTASNSSNFTFGAGVGGDGGSVNPQGGVTRTLYLSGTNVRAAYFASVGGDGGEHGNPGNVTPGGAGGHGAAVTVNGTWAVTSADGSTTSGLQIYSIGGSGGEGGQFSTGDGGDGGNAGTVTVLTDGDSSIGVATNGILAAATGGDAGINNPNGDGGMGGDVYFGLNASGDQSTGTWTIETTNGPGITLRSTGGAAVGDGAGGTGGKVSASGELSVTTSGSYSSGLVLESTGGDAETGIGGAGADIVAAATIDISTNGTGSHGVEAVSSAGAGGTPGAGSLTLGFAGEGINAPGEQAWGILAQSGYGGSNGGNIAISLSELTVLGGISSSSSATDGGGIFVAGGTDLNTVTNTGTITNADGADGVAVKYQGSGKLTITNLSGGTLTGEVINAVGASAGVQATAAIAGTIELINARGGLVEAGARFDTARFENRGRFSPAGVGAHTATSIDGDYVQSDTGTLAIDISGRGGHDTVVVTGLAEIDGMVEVAMTHLNVPLIGFQTRQILSADGGLTVADGLGVNDSAVGRFRLIEDADNDILQVGFEIDFGNEDATGALNDNQENIARHLQELYEAALLDPTLGGLLLTLEDSEAYAEFLNELSAEFAIANQIGAHYATRAFNEQLLSCAATDGGGAARFLDDGQCAFLTFAGSGFERDATSDNLGFTGSAWSLSGGGQLVLGDAWTLGGALAYESQQLDIAGTSASSDGHMVFAGASLKRHIGAFELGAVSSIGFGTYDIERAPLGGALVNGNQDLWSVSGRIHAAYVLGSEKAFLKPSVDVGLDHFFGSDFTESGPAGVSLAVDMDSETYVSISPAVEVGAELTGPNGYLFRLHASVGLTQYLNDPTPSLTAQFVNAGTALPGFETSTEFARTFVDLSGGMDVFANEHAVLRAEGFTRLSSDDTIYGGGLRVEIPF